MKITTSTKSPLAEANALRRKHPRALILAHAAYEDIPRSTRLAGFTHRDHLRGFEPGIVILDFWSMTRDLIVAAVQQLGRRPGLCRIVICTRRWPTT